MARSRRTGIRRSIEQLLIPALIARGFEQFPATDDSQLSPFGRFRRRTDRGLELIEIPFNKNRTSHFCLHFAREGITEAEYDAAVMRAVESLPVIERYFEKGKTTLAMRKYPDGPGDNWGYAGLCIGVVLGSFYAVIWFVGFLVRHI